MYRTTDGVNVFVAQTSRLLAGTAIDSSAECDLRLGSSTLVHWSYKSSTGININAI